MSVDPSVTAALEAAIAADPGNPALRVHLASLLVMTGDATRALEHAQAALNQAPDDAEALAAARDAAQALGDHARAESYTRLLRAGNDEEPPREAVRGLGDDRWLAPEEDEELVIPDGFSELDPEGLIEAARPRVTL